MSKFFIRRPIVAIVIAILTTIVGVVSMLTLPTAQFPDIAPPEIQIQANYAGADAKTLLQSVSTPLEQQITGVDNMLYMYSVNANNGQAQIFVDFDVKTNPGHRSDPHAAARFAGAGTAARCRPRHRRHSGSEVAHLAVDDRRALLSGQPLRRDSSSPTTPSSSCRMRSPASPGVARVYRSSVASMRLRVWVEPGQARAARSHRTRDHQRRCRRRTT